VVAGALEFSDKMVGPLRRMAEHRYLFSGLEPSFEAAGSAWRPAPGDPLTSPGQGPLVEDPGPGPGRAFPAACSDTPGRVLGSCRWRRYGWSWPEPPAGATPHQRRAPPSPGKDRGLRAAGVTNGQSDGGALEPFH
jgi:hypothetical protein